MGGLGGRGEVTLPRCTRSRLLQQVFPLWQVVLVPTNFGNISLQLRQDFLPDSSEKPHPSGQHCFSLIPACYPPRASGRYGPPNTCERSLPFAVRYTSVAAELSDPLPNLFQRSPLSISPASAEATATR